MIARRLSAKTLRGESARYERPRTAKEAAILAAATEIFGAKGFRDARTADIAASAGVTERTLFRYFPTKDSLYRRVMFPAVLADSVSIWPDLLKIAKSDDITRKTRRSAVFWLGQAAGDAATKGLTDLVDDGNQDREVRESAVFALSQRPRDEGVPALIRIARENKDPDLRRKAIFWLGQSDDPRALSLFEELLTKP